jgi:flagellar M-ring protein FliF
MDFKTLFSQLVVVYSKLTKTQRIIIAGAVVGIIAFLVFLVVYSSSGTKGGNYAVLFEKLSDDDAAKVIKNLEKEGVSYKIAGNNVIEVPKDIVYKERIKIAAMGIPKDNTVGFELFNKQQFGATRFDQNIKYLRALEGELSRTISALEPVENATVSLAIPKQSLFISKQISPTASIMVKLVPNMSLTNAQIRGIKNLVAASVPRLLIKNVTLVNSDGVTLGANDAAAQMNDASVLEQEYKKSQEKQQEQKIINVLAPFLGGASHVVAEVNIEYDFSQKSSKSEVYDPNNVVRSEQTVSVKSKGSQPSSGGVPGAVSNIGPVKGVTSSNTGNEYSKTSDTTNYEISKTISSTKDQFARIKRITAAVVVDGKYRYKASKNGQKSEQLEYIPLDQSQLDAIQSLVEQAIGINLKRGDQVSVKNFEFRNISNKVQKGNVDKALSLFNLYIKPFLPVLKYIFVILLLFILYKKIIAPFAAQMLEVSKEDEEVHRPTLSIEDEDDDGLVERVKQMRKKVEDQLGVGENFSEDELKYDVLLEKIKNIADEHPEEVANLIQNLLAEEIAAHAPRPSRMGE